MKILFSPSANNDLEMLRTYLGDVSPVGLRSVLNAIQGTIQDIPENISRGRATPHKDVWEKIVPKYGYIIPYMVRDNTVYILHVYNSRRKPLDYAQIEKDIARFLSK